MISATMEIFRKINGEDPLTFLDLGDSRPDIRKTNFETRRTAPIRFMAEDVDEIAKKILADLYRQYPEREEGELEFARTFALAFYDRVRNWQTIADRIGSPQKTNLHNFANKTGHAHRPIEGRRLWDYIKEVGPAKKVDRVHVEIPETDDFDSDEEADIMERDIVEKDVVDDKLVDQLVEQIEKYKPFEEKEEDRTNIQITRGKPDGAGYVYILTDRPDEVLNTDAARWKIGSSRSPQTRCAQLRTGNLDLRFVAAFPVTRRLSAESAVHNELKKQGRHIQLEWFRGSMQQILMAVTQFVQPYHK